MKKFIFMTLIFLSCNNESARKADSRRKTAAKTTFAKAMAEGLLYKVFSADSSEVFRARFVRVLGDSSDRYIENYAKSFRYITNIQKMPTEKLVTSYIDNPIIYNVKE